MMPPDMLTSQRLFLQAQPVLLPHMPSRTAAEAADVINHASLPQHRESCLVFNAYLCAPFGDVVVRLLEAVCIT